MGEPSRLVKYCVDLRVDGLVSIIIEAGSEQEAQELAFKYAEKNGLPVDDLIGNPSFHIGVASVSPVRESPPLTPGLDEEYTP